MGLRRWFPDELQHQGLDCYYSACLSSVHACADWKQRFGEMSQRTGNDVHLDLKRKCIDYLKMLLLLKHLHDWGMAPVELKGEKSERHTMVNIITNTGFLHTLLSLKIDVYLPIRLKNYYMRGFDCNTIAPLLPDGVVAEKSTAMLEVGGSIPGRAKEDNYVKIGGPAALLGAQRVRVRNRLVCSESG